MAYPSKLPGPEVLVRLIAQPEMTEAEIARQYHTTRSAVSQALRRAHVSPERPRVIYRDEIPWKILAEDMQDYTAKMLRAYGAERMGNPVSPARRQALARFKAELDERDEVVAYDRERPKGERFHLVPRRPEDVGYTRKPD